MARNHARIFTSIWIDPDFLERTGAEQRLYLLLLSQPDLNQAGVMPLRVRRWATLADGDSIESVEAALAGLERNRFVVVDRDTEELLIRSFIRNDGVWRQPNVFRAAVRSVQGTLSRTLRAVLLEELDRLPLGDLSRSVRAKVTQELTTLNPLRTLPVGPVEPSREPFAEPFPEPLIEGFAEPIEQTQGVGGRGSSCSSRSSHFTSSFSSETATPPPDDLPAEPVRPEVEDLCAHLADRIEANGSKRPPVTKGWRDACRLMLDRDRRTVANVRAAIDWCQDSEFWRSNVMSMPTLRKQFDRLRLEAHREKRQAVDSGNSRNGRARHQPYTDPKDQSVYDQDMFGDDDA